MSYWYLTERNAEDKLPILLFLHGIGEAGGEHVKQVVKHGLWANVNAAVSLRLRSFFRIASHIPQEKGSWNPDQLRELVLDIRERHNDVLPNRLLSCWN
jgi:hypothetical protein